MPGFCGRFSARSSSNSWISWGTSSSADGGWLPLLVLRWNKRNRGNIFALSKPNRISELEAEIAALRGRRRDA